MPFWSQIKWQQLSNAAFPVSPRINDRIDEAGYRLAIGREIYLTDAKGSAVQKLDDDQSFFIAPGQFAYILTDEDLNIPLNAIGFISIRASIKFYGLVNVSGFHVDPGYSGKLVFAVFNSGPTRINLKQGQDIFSLWVADLDRPIKKGKIGVQHLGSDLINKIDGNHLTAYQLDEKISKIADLADSNKNKLTYLTAVSSAVLLIFGIIIAPIAKTQISKYWDSFTASDSATVSNSQPKAESASN